MTRKRTLPEIVPTGNRCYTPSTSTSMIDIAEVIRRKVRELRRKKHVDGLSTQELINSNPTLDPNWVISVTWYQIMPCIEWEDNHEALLRDALREGVTRFLDLAEGLGIKLSPTQRMNLSNGRQ